MAATHSKNTYLSVKYRRLAARRGTIKALVAIERTMLVTIWNLGTTGALYTDPGADYYTRMRPDRTKQRALAQLASLGYRVTLEESA